MLEMKLHEEADEELKAAAVFYELRLTGLGENFLARVSESLDLISTNPLAGHLWFDDYRRILTRQFPYSLVYRVEGDRVYVIAVAHWSRRPDYWKERS